jgi:hypothetical protein
MTIEDILKQAQALSPAERHELAHRLLEEDAPESEHQPKTGAQIVAMLKAMDGPIEFVDPHIEDPVEWVKAQRQKEQDRLKPYRGDEE